MVLQSVKPTIVFARMNTCICINLIGYISYGTNSNNNKTGEFYFFLF